MQVNILKNRPEMGKAAANASAILIRAAIDIKGEANIVLATGQSQFEVFKNLTHYTDIDWTKVRMFHLDEYIGLSINHPASFRKYLQERFIQKIGKLKEVVLINGENDPIIECQRLNEQIKDMEIDVAQVGFGENGHIAFNDPPADFKTKEPFIIVNLDDACRQQQLAEGWFPDLASVPKQAISMSVQQIMKAKHIICSVPGSRKTEAVYNCMKKGVSNLYPASILQKHPQCQYFFDEEAALLIS